MHELMAS